MPWFRSVSLSTVSVVPFFTPFTSLFLGSSVFGEFEFRVNSLVREFEFCFIGINDRCQFIRQTNSPSVTAKETTLRIRS